ncbi:MAG TPA: hypothetical protein VK968_18435 [Roseimicrobium sp.]|nr:hypothetical protein [Roseimicrobium sp.]
MSHHLITRIIETAAMTGDDGWNLMEWCADHGANDFTVRFAAEAATGGTDSPSSALRKALTPFHLATVERDQVDRLLTPKPGITTDVWRMCPESVDLLRQHAPHGLFSKTDPAAHPAITDFILYRNGVIMLGVDNREGVVLISLTETESTELLG